MRAEDRQRTGGAAPPGGRGTSPRAVAAREQWQRDRRRRTRRSIRAAALDLFAREGFDAVTIDQIAAAAGVSPVTFFRYFPAKEDLILGPPDLVFLEEIAAHAPAPSQEEAGGPSEAGETEAGGAPGILNRVAEAGEAYTRAADDETVARLEYRMRLIAGTPALRAALYARSADWTDAVSGLLARESPRLEESVLERHLIARLVIVVGVEVLLMWGDRPESTGREGLLRILGQARRAFALL